MNDGAAQEAKESGQVTALMNLDCTELLRAYLASRLLMIHHSQPL